VIVNCADLLTIITGRLFVRIERVYELYNGLTGDNLFTHQLPRASKFYAPLARMQYPEMTKWLESRTISRSNYLSVLAEATRTFGDVFGLTECGVEWGHKDAMAELVEMVDPDRIIGVVAED